MHGQQDVKRSSLLLKCKRNKAYLKTLPVA